MRAPFKSIGTIAGLAVMLFLLISLLSKNGDISYNLRKSYQGNNAYNKGVYYLNTSEQLDSNYFWTLIELYNQDYPNQLATKAFILFHQDKHYATIISSTDRLDGIEFEISEYFPDNDALLAFRKEEREKVLRKVRYEPKHDSILGVWKCYLNGFVPNMVIKKRTDTGTYHAKEFSGFNKVTVDGNNYHKQFNRFGETGGACFERYWSDGTKTIHKLYYITNENDLLIKSQGDKGGIDVVCRPL